MVALGVLIKPEFRDAAVIGIDPGETTGICLFLGEKLIRAEQLRTKPLGDGITAIGDWVSKHVHSVEGNPQCYCSYEDYRIYDWKSNTHKWSELHTPKLIGAIECLMLQFGIPCESRMAVAAKGFFTDDKLREWGLYKLAKRHSRDAIRHALYQMVFGGVST